MRVEVRGRPARWAVGIVLVCVAAGVWTLRAEAHSPVAANATGRSASGFAPSGTDPQALTASADLERSAASAKRLQVCQRPSLRQGPAHKPRGARRVKLSTNLPALVNRARAGTTFWLTPGVHTFGPGQYNQVIPKNGDRFIGAPGAIIDGRHVNLFAFTQRARRVWIEYLTIKDFGPAGANDGQGVVNHDSGIGWHVVHNTIEGNAGAGVMIGTNDVIRENCLADNGQYGFNAYSPSGPHNITLGHNEIVGNDTYNWETKDPGCGCSGGGKFWDSTNVTVANNYVHDNHNVGLWADTDNSGFDFENNVISHNFGEGIIYETSYDAVISHNTFTDNGWGTGPETAGFPTGAIYVSESGGDSRLNDMESGKFDITHNRFTDNWSGVVLWENADRFCGSPLNASAGYCTLGDPKVANSRTCIQTNIASQPYTADCRWKTRYVHVEHNTFDFDPASIGAACTVAHECGLNGVFSQYGTQPSWSPYRGTVVENNITFRQHNRFSNNKYIGPWRFMAHDQGTVLAFKGWRAAPYSQDAGSTYQKG